MDPWDDVALDFEGEIDGDLVDMWDAVLPSGPQVGTAARVLGVHASESYSEEQTRALFVFRYLLVFVAALESFAHGANDTGNATGALLPPFRPTSCRPTPVDLLRWRCVISRRLYTPAACCHQDPPDSLLRLYWRLLYYSPMLAMLACLISELANAYSAPPYVPYHT